MRHPSMTYSVTKTMLNQHVRLDCEMFTYARSVGDSFASAWSRDKLPGLKIRNAICRSPSRLISTDSGVMAKAVDAAARTENHRSGPIMS